VRELDGERPTLILSGGHRHRALWEPLAERYQLVFLESSAAAAAESMLDSASILRVEEFLVDEHINAAKAEAMWQARKVMVALENGLTFDDDVDGLRQPGLNGWLPTSVYELATASYVRVFAAMSCVEKMNVVGVLVHEDVTPEGRLLAQFGISEDLPTIHVPHANHFLGPGSTDIHCQVTAQYIGASGTHMRDWYMACGVPADRIRLVGAPQWDWLYKEHALPERGIARKALGKTDDGLVITYGGTWGQDTGVWGNGAADIEAGWQTMLAAAKELGAYLIVKEHPGETPDRDKKYSEEMEAAGVSGAVTRVHNEYALRAADCLVTQGSSNLAVEAAIVGTPAVELYQCSTRYPDYGPRGTWGDGLADLVHEAIGAGPLKEFERAMNYDADGGAVDRIVEWVGELC